MTSSSDLTQLYHGAFGVKPSDELVALLTRMEAFCGISNDDSLTRMLILQLRVADYATEGEHKLADERKKLSAEMRTLMGEWRSLIVDANMIRSTNNVRVGPIKYFQEPLLIATYRKSSPLLSYLLNAFRSKRGSMDDDERIGSARFDLLMLLGSLIVFSFAGVIIGRFK